MIKFALKPLSQEPAGQQAARKTDSFVLSGFGPSTFRSSKYEDKRRNCKKLVAALHR